MAESHHVSILDHFADLDDPRVERTRRHKLVDIIAIAICATICGADSWVHVDLFRQEQAGMVPNLSGAARGDSLP